MGQRMTVYVGPYLTVPKEFDWTRFDSILQDGRMEAGESDTHTVLIPVDGLLGDCRQMRVDPYGEMELQRIEPGVLLAERLAFGVAVKDLISHCELNGVEVQKTWGVVPCVS